MLSPIFINFIRFFRLELFEKEKKSKSKKLSADFFFFTLSSDQYEERPSSDREPDLTPAFLEDLG